MEERLFMKYQALNDLTVPLRDVVKFEACIVNDSNASDTCKKLIYAEGQLNTSLRELGNMVSKNMHACMIAIIHIIQIFNCIFCF